MKLKCKHSTELISCSQLKSIDLQKEFTIHSDASNLGLGATWLQDNRPVAFASRLLSDSEKKYPTVVRELLAFKFAVVGDTQKYSSMQVFTK